MTQIIVKSDSMFIRTNQFARTWALGRKGAVTRSIQIANWSIPMLDPAPPAPECFFDGLLRHTMRRDQPDYPELRLKEIGKPLTGRGPVLEGEHQRVSAVWEEPAQGAVLARTWKIYPGADAIVTKAEIASDSAPQLEFGRNDYLSVVESLPIDAAGWDVCAVGLWGRTDHNNDLVRLERRHIGALEDTILLRGNLLFLEPPGGGRGLFILVESPPPDERRSEIQADFRIGTEGIQILGWNLVPAEVLPDRRRQSYDVAVGGYIGGESAKLHAVRTFLKARYPTVPELRTIVANPWGDHASHKYYNDLNEAFVLKELDACAKLGATYYQIDDGWEAGDHLDGEWQAGGELADLQARNAARSLSFWDINSKRFPNGFSPLVRRCRALGIRLALWFAPDFNRLYRNWREECDVLLDLHRRYGIDLFKIDAVWLRTRESEENLIALLESVHRESNGRVLFNMDATAGRRQGHIAMLRYGNVFLENRYVRPGRAERANTYVPWRVLRNLWNLSRYLPPERIQIEVPNCHQPCFHSEAEIADAFEMKRCGDDYLASLALFASPLFWGEPSRMPAPALAEIRPVLDLHRSIGGELAASHIFPVGEEPGGRQWTGFQAVNPGTAQGLLLAFRENTPSDRFEFDLPFGAESGPFVLECLSHPESPVRMASPRRALIHIPRPNDFRLFRYRPAG